MAIRNDFPLAGSDYLGGTSDGWEYKTIFAGTNLERSYDMVRAFLVEEGYKDVIIPASAKELRMFRKKENNSQLSFFREIGYIHNPIKILFNPNEKRSVSLILCIYREDVENHLVKFHGLI